VLPRRARSPASRRTTYVAFAAAGRRWALRVEEVAAVGALGPVTRLPTADPRRLGLALHGGQVVALLAPEALAAGPVAGEAGAGAPGPASHVIVLRRGGGSVGLPVEELLGLRVLYGPGVPAGFEPLSAERAGGASLEGT
jgi:chemotaxis signal transduction protein